MPESTATIDAPPQKTDTTFGDKFRKELARINVAESGDGNTPPAGPTGPVGEPAGQGTTGPTGTESAATGPTGVTVSGATGPEDKKPSSALEAALGDKDDKPAEQKDELEEFEKIETPKSEDWKRAREVMKRQGTELQALRTAKPAADPNVDAITQERDALRGEVEKLNSNLKAINAEYSPEFQALVADREKVISKIAGKMKYSGGAEKSDDLIAALNMPDGKMKNQAVKEAMADLETDDRMAVRALIERLDEHDEKITDFRKDLPAQWDRLKAETEKEMRERGEQEMKLLETEFGKVVDLLPKDIVRMRLVPDDVSGAKEWNEPIKAAIDGALAALKPNGTDFKGTVRLAIQGGLYDHLWKDYVVQNKELKEARARLQEFDAGGPDFRGKGAPSGKAGEGKTPGQKYHEALAAGQSSGVAP